MAVTFPERQSKGFIHVELAFERDRNLHILLIRKLETQTFIFYSCMRIPLLLLMYS